MISNDDTRKSPNFGQNGFLKRKIMKNSKNTVRIPNILHRKDKKI